jgi:flagellar hook-length control protein FliK
MNTSPILNPANIAQNLLSTGKQLDGAAPDVSFNQVLSREIADRRSQRDAENANTSTQSSNAAQPASPAPQTQSGTPGTSKAPDGGTTTSENSDKPTEASDAEPDSASVEMLALVQASVIPIDPRGLPVIAAAAATDAATLGAAATIRSVGADKLELSSAADVKDLLGKLPAAAPTVVAADLPDQPLASGPLAGTELNGKAAPIDMTELKARFAPLGMQPLAKATTKTQAQDLSAMTKPLQAPAVMVADQPVKAPPVALADAPGAAQPVALADAPGAAQPVAVENGTRKVQANGLDVLQGKIQAIGLPQTSVKDGTASMTAKDTALTLKPAIEPESASARTGELKPQLQTSTAPATGTVTGAPVKTPEALPELLVQRGLDQNAAKIPEMPSAATVGAMQQTTLGNTQAIASQASDKLSPPVGSPGWDQALGQKVAWMVVGGQQSASLTLNPPDLGPMQVVLSVTNSQASATFTAAQPEVRQAIEAAMPKLREMMAETGIQLGQTNVSAGTPNQNQYGAPGEQARQVSHAFLQAGKIADALPIPVRPLTSRSGQGVIDTFA